MSIRIFGAGMAGLLASEMLRKVRPITYEAQPYLPDNHGALLRFRTDAVARETGQPFRRVRVLKAVKSGGRVRPVSTLRDANQYSYKVTGAVAARSILDLAPCDRYIAPDNFLNLMARDAVLRMNSAVTIEELQALKGQREISAISTIPMPALMKIVGWDTARADFSYRPIWSQTVELDAPSTNVYQTIYYPEPDDAPYRASITGNRLILEWMEEPTNIGTDIRHALLDFGIPVAGYVPHHAEVKRHQYGKLLPMNEKERHEFIMAMTDEFNIYSVGRFATWRQILLDDVVHDVRVVESMIMQRNAYLRRLGK